jgi:hypothetical protein
MPTYYDDNCLDIVWIYEVLLQILIVIREAFVYLLKFW